jgi:hypothetical protein
MSTAIDLELAPREQDTAPSGDPAQLAAGLLRATGPERDPLARAAFERSRVFTWEHAAEQTMDAYRAAINAPPR